jgi:hypothetical protein
MSSILTRIARLARALFTAGTPPLDPEAMSLHDWADLPTHHPGKTGTPC